MDSESQSKYISMFAYVCVFMCVRFMHVHTAWKTMPGTVDDSCCGTKIDTGLTCAIVQVCKVFFVSL